MKIGLTLPQGCDREYSVSTRRPRGSGRSRSPSAPSGSASSRSGSTTTCRSTRRRIEAPVFEPFVEMAALALVTDAGQARPSGRLRRLPQRRPAREDDLDHRRHQRRPRDPRHRRRVEGGRVARLRLRLPRRAHPAGHPRATTSRSSPACSRPGRATYSGAARPRHRRDPRAEGAADRRASRSSSAATGRRSPGAWPPASPTSSTSTRCRRPRSAAALPVIRARCEEIGRDPATLPVSVHLWGPAIDLAPPARPGGAVSRSTPPSASSE